MGLVIFVLLCIVFMGNCWRWFPEADDDYGE